MKCECVCVLRSLEPDATFTHLIPQYKESKDLEWAESLESWTNKEHWSNNISWFIWSRDIFLWLPARCTFPLHWPALCCWWKEWTGSSSNEAKWCRIQRFLPAKMESRVPDPRNIPSGYVKIAIENGHLRLIYPLKMVIFHNYVSWMEYSPYWCWCMGILCANESWRNARAGELWTSMLGSRGSGWRWTAHLLQVEILDPTVLCPPAGWMSWGPGGLDCAIFRSALQVPTKWGSRPMMRPIVMDTWRV